MKESSIVRLVFFRLAIALIMVAGPGIAMANTGPEYGRALVIDSSKGNCVACHKIAGLTSASSKAGIGPDLADIRQRFPDLRELRAIIWNLAEKVPNTIMPPYGKHRILTEREIDAVVRYLETL